MLFNSFKYIIFLPVLLLFYFVFPAKLKNWWLLICSYFFYMSWNAAYGILLFACTAVSYAGAIALQKLQGCEASKRKAVLAATLTLLFASLAFYKYSNFILQNLFRLLHIAGIKTSVQLDILLPVGISFFTFQAAGYVIDVYRKDIDAEKDFFRYALFVSFFPQLVAGPIERSRNLQPQFAEPKNFDFDRAKDGVFIMLWGYFLKMVLADRAAIFVNSAYAHPYDTEGMTLIFATVFFAFQIYGDFYGYSLIAKGSARILGFDLMDNFKSPYCALSVQDFWRRWHISLSTWFRDYVYFPLGGSRCSKLRTYFNIIAVMALSGLWHGAGWHFIAWGLLHGILQVADRITHGVQEKFPKMLRRFAMFFWICIGWCLFRAPSLKSALYSLKAMGGFILKHRRIHDFYNMGLGWTELKMLYLCIFILMAVDAFNYKGVCVRSFLQKRSALTQILIVAASVVFIVAVGVWGGEYNAADFIYFQF